MRIAIDARELRGRPTGVGRYLRQILSSWNDDARARQHELILCAPGPVDTRPYGGLRLDVLVDAGQGTWWEQRILPRLIERSRTDVLFAPAYTAPLFTPIPTVLVIHDVSFAAHPEWFSWREGARRRVISRLAAERAARVVASSEFSRAEIGTHLGIDRHRIEVVRLGVSNLVLPPPTDTGRVSVLFVGSIFNRRHVPELIDGFAVAARARPALHLDIVGENRTTPYVDLPEYVRAAGVSDRVHLRSYVDEEELARCYANAHVFAFLSDYEGFGLTPLEALGAGIPILVLDTVVAREIYGDAAVYVTRPEREVIAAALERILFDPRERTRLLEAARPVLARYSWDRCAERVLDLLESAAAGSRDTQKP